MKKSIRKIKSSPPTLSGKRTPYENRKTVKKYVQSAMPRLKKIVSQVSGEKMKVKMSGYKLIEKLYRRICHPTNAVPVEWHKDFILRSVADAYDTFSKIVTMSKKEVGEIEVYFGRRKKSFDGFIDKITPAPYYLWCRCVIAVTTDAMKDALEAEKLKRNKKGLLPFTLI